MAISKFNYNSFNVTPVAGNALSFNSDADGFTTKGASAMVLIKTITASNDANVDFEHGSSSVVLDSTYPVYIIKFINVHPVTNDTQFFFQANGAGETGFNETITSSSTTFVKHFMVKHQHQQHASQSYQSYVGGYFNTTTAIDQIVFAFGSGNIDSGTFKLYGIKDS